MQSSAPKEWQSTLGIFVAAGVRCTRCAHGNKVRLGGIYYHTLSVGVLGEGYNCGMRAPEGFQSKEVRDVKIV